MGCDIHCYVEARVENEWILINNPIVRRNYQFFGRIAGVRDEDQIPIAKDRGLPEDLSVGTRLAWEYWQPDAHSMTWITGEEAEQLDQEYKNEYGGPPYPAWCGYLFGHGLNYIPEVLRDRINDVRVVIWFDN